MGALLLPLADHKPTMKGSSMIRTIILSVALSLLSPFVSSVAFADEQLTLPEAIKALEGDWEGELTYRDFRSNERVSIPHNRTISVGPNGGYVLIENVYIDPGYRVYSAELYRVTDETLTIASTTDTSVEVTNYTLISTDQQASQLTARFEGAGSDNGGQALVRLEVSLGANSFSVRRLVKADGADDFQFRNEIRFQRDT